MSDDTYSVGELGAEPDEYENRETRMPRVDGRPLIPTIGGLTDGEYEPVCPRCDGLVRRNLTSDPHDWRCDLHGPVVPVWKPLEARNEGF